MATTRRLVDHVPPAIDDVDRDVEQLRREPAPVAVAHGGAQLRERPLGEQHLRQQVVAGGVVRAGQVEVPAGDPAALGVEQLAVDLAQPLQFLVGGDPGDRGEAVLAELGELTVGEDGAEVGGGRRRAEHRSVLAPSGDAGLHRNSTWREVISSYGTAVDPADRRCEDVKSIAHLRAVDCDTATRGTRSMRTPTRSRQGWLLGAVTVAAAAAVAGFGLAAPSVRGDHADRQRRHRRAARRRQRRRADPRLLPGHVRGVDRGQHDRHGDLRHAHGRRRRGQLRPLPRREHRAERRQHRVDHRRPRRDRVRRRHAARRRGPQGQLRPPRRGRDARSRPGSPARSSTR